MVISRPLSTWQDRERGHWLLMIPGAFLQEILYYLELRSDKRWALDRRYQSAQLGLAGHLRSSRLLGQIHILCFLCYHGA